MAPLIIRFMDSRVILAFAARSSCESIRSRRYFRINSQKCEDEKGAMGVYNLALQEPNAGLATGTVGVEPENLTDFRI